MKKKKNDVKALSIVEGSFSTLHPTISSCQNDLALVLQDPGDYEGAKDLLERAKKSNEQNFGEQHPKTATS